MSDANRNLAELEAKIKAQEDRANRSMVVSIAVSAVLVLIMLVYFSYLGSMLREAADPDGVASVLSDQVRDQIPALSRELQATAKELAPALVDDMITNAIAVQLPAARKNVENQIKEESVKYLNKHEDTLLGGFDEIFDNHRERVNEMLTKLTNEQGQKEFEEDLYGIMRESLDDQAIRVELDSYAHTLKDVDELLMLIAEDPNSLDPQQASLRRVIALVREIASRTDVGKIDLRE